MNAVDGGTTKPGRVQRFAEGDGKKRNNVGFALQILQRRLASSPAAIYQSLKRRRERLETELGEARLAAKGRQAGIGEPAINGEGPNERLNLLYSLQGTYPY